jgi:hypothetical protein
MAKALFVRRPKPLPAIPEPQPVLVGAGER